MKPIGINRRTLLATMATMATLPVLPPLLAESSKKAASQGADSRSGRTLPGRGRALEPGERSVWVTKDLVTDFGGDLNAWNNYYTMQSGPVTLTIPAGTFDLRAAPLARPAGVYEPRSCVIQGAGKASTFAKIRQCGGFGTPDRGGRWPRLQDCKAGDTTSTVIPEDRTVRALKPGRWHVICGADMMGYGYPQNNAIYEYHKMISYDSVTGVIQWDAPLVNSYKNHWPKWWDVGPPRFDGAGAPDPCGTPTIIELGGRFTVEDPLPVYGRGGWDQEVVIRDLTVTNSHDLGEWWYGTCRQIHWENVDFQPPSGAGRGFPPTPTISKRWTHKNCTMMGQEVEFDKMVEHSEYDGCNVHYLNLQSASPRTLVLKNSNLNYLVGQGVNTTIDNCTIGFMRVGVGGYGSAPINMSISNSSVGAAEGIDTPNRYLDDTPSIVRSVADNNWAGVFTVPMGLSGHDFNRWRIEAQPGGYFRMRTTGPVFKIVDYWMNAAGDTVYYQTDKVGKQAWGLFAWAYDNTPDWDCTMVPHFCPFLTVTNCTGDKQIAAYSHRGGTRPYQSYYFEDFPGPNYHSNGWLIFGMFVEMTVNVVKPYTGTMNPFSIRVNAGSGSAFVTYPTWCSAGGHPAGWECHIDLRTAGLRRITTTTMTGMQPTDGVTNNVPLGANQYIDAGASVWHDQLLTSGDIYDQILTEDPSVWPHFTVEVILDQGFY